MRYDDDDFVDYDDYGEDEAVDEVMSVLGPDATEDEVLAALEQTDYDVDAAIAQLRPAEAARARKKEEAKADAAAAAAPVAPQQTTGSSQGKLPQLSKLQMLAKKPGTGGLAALKQKKEGSPAGTGPAESRLAALARLKKGQDQDTVSSGHALSALQRFKERESARKAVPAAASHPSQVVPTPTEVSQPSNPHNPSGGTSVEISYAIEKQSLPTPSRFGSLLGSLLYIPPVLPIANIVDTNAQTRAAFAQDSPDDRVLAAQSAAFAPKTTAKVPESTKSTLAPTKASTKPKDALISQLESLNLRPHISFVVIGHVDAGKSTLMGRMLLDSGAVSGKTVSKHERDSAKVGKSSFALAWVMDATNEERQRGVTVDIGEATFDTDKVHFTVLDAPGHRDYVPNMIAGVAQADVAVLVVDSDTNAFESGFCLDGQTKEHAILARSLGIDTLVVAVNKLDTNGWSEERFDDIRVQLTEFLSKTVGFDTSKLIFVPTSGKTGNYVFKQSSAAGWYSGPSLVGALEGTGVTKRDIAAPFRFIVSNAYQEEYQPNITVFGRAVSGLIEKDDPIVNCSEQGVQGVVKQVNDSRMIAGQVGELKLDLSLDKCRAGDVLASPEGALEPVRRFTGKVILFDLQKPLLQGARLSFYMGRVDCLAKLVKINATVDRKGVVLKKRPLHLKKGQSAVATFELDKPVVLLPFSENKDLGRFVLRLDGKTVGGGIVQDTNAASA